MSRLPYWKVQAACMVVIALAAGLLRLDNLGIILTYGLWLATWELAEGCTARRYRRYRRSQPR